MEIWSIMVCILLFWGVENGHPERRITPAVGAARNGRGRPASTPDELLPETQALDQLAVAVVVLAAEVLQEAAPPSDHLQQPTPRMVILRVGLEMLGQVCNAGSQQRDLDLGRSRIGVVRPVLLDDVRLPGLEFSNVHSASQRLEILTLFL
jgi:hypothetical protein